MARIANTATVTVLRASFRLWLAERRRELRGERGRRTHNETYAKLARMSDLEARRLELPEIDHWAGRVAVGLAAVVSGVTANRSACCLIQGRYRARRSDVALVQPSDRRA